MVTTRVRSRRGEGDRLREEILEAVSALLDETRDESAVSIRAIAERVGVTPPSIYRHFEDKEAMLSAVCAEVFVQLTDGIERAVAGAATPLDALAQAGRCYIDFGLAHPEHYRLVFMRSPLKGEDLDHSGFRSALETGVMPESHPLFSGDALAGSQAFKGLYDLIDLATAGVPSKRRPDTFAMTTSLWATVHGIVSLRISKPDFVWPTVDEQMEAVMWPYREALQGARALQGEAE